jgi:uncharacterized protein
MRLIVMFALIVGLAAVAYVGTTGYFLARALAGILDVGAAQSAELRAEPPSDPLTPGYRGNPMLALSLPFEIVAIETPLGPVDAWLVPAAGTEVGRAIYVHGIAGAREDGYRHLSMLHEAGWSVLLIGYRNDADAPADPQGLYGLGLLEWPDLEAAVAQFSPGPDGPGLLIVAESMGGAILGQFLSQSALAGRVSAVALDSPALSFSAIVAHLANRGSAPFAGLTGAVAVRVAPRLTGLPLAKAEVAEVYAAFPGPLFLAHGAGDRLVPLPPSQAMAAGRTAPTTTLWTGADHLGSYAEDPAAYRAAFAEFLKQIGA